MAGKIFINYRRTEDRGFARLLFDKLKSVFGEDRLFMDVEKLGGTNDFPETLAQEIRASSVLLVMIGKEWLCLEDENGRRLGRADDFVTMEIALALSLGKVVIPILVNGVPPLQEQDLPPALRQLWKCNALPLANDRFEGDVLKIAKTIGNQLGWNDADVARALLQGSQMQQGKPLEIWLAKWDYIKSSENRNDFIEFLNSNPPEDIARLAAKSLERLDWKSVSANPDIESLERFLHLYPDGEHASQAQQELQRLKTEARLEAERKVQAALREEERKAAALREAERKAQEALREEERRRQAALDAERKSQEERIRLQKQEAERQAKAALEAERKSQEECIRLQKQQKEKATRQKIRRIKISAAVLAAVCLALLILGPVRYSAVTPGHWLWFQLGGGLVRTFTGHTTNVSSVAFSPDGRLALSGSYGMRSVGGMKLWDVATGNGLRSFSEHAGDVYSVAFSPDGRFALSSGDSMKLWDLSPYNGAAR